MMLALAGVVVVVTAAGLGCILGALVTTVDDILDGEE